MSEYQIEKRFGTIAVERKYITATQLHTAMAIQIDEDLCGKEHRLLGQILLEKGYMTPQQIREVLKHMGIPTRFCLCNYKLSPKIETETAP
jgi:hypothetical protein